MTRGRGDRGAALVEFALVGMLLVVLLFGTVEFGLAWQDRNVVETTARAGARVASSMGDDRYADWNALQSVKAAVNDVGLSNVDYVIVYKSATVDGAVPSACLGATPTSQSGSCNVYTGAQLQTLTVANFTGTLSCTGSSPDLAWCPTTRQTLQALGTDYVGVYIKAKHDMITQLFGSTLSLTTNAVMRIEPA
jgi:Flp pilus assembly protein TadG